jgi:hypothetical protein
VFISRIFFEALNKLFVRYRRNWLVNLDRLRAGSKHGSRPGRTSMQMQAIRLLKLSAAAVVMVALAYGGEAFAEKKKEPAMPKPPACRTIKVEADCTPREDCTWRDAVKKGDKIVRRGSCAAKPKPKPAKKTKSKTEPM